MKAERDGCPIAALARAAGAVCADTVPRYRDHFPHLHTFSQRYAAFAEGYAPVDEALTVPPVDGLQLRAPEPELIAAGWRFVAVPSHPVRTASWRRHAPALDWQIRTWLAVPPRRMKVAAQHFDKKCAALAWAKQQCQPEVRS